MNNYHIYEEIGRGKYSIVYKGRKKKVIEYVAVKSMEKTRRKKVLNEVKIFHNLNHTNILKFFNWYETKNHLWIIFEYCAGGDLMQLIEQDKSLPENVVKSFGLDLVSGLQYLHSHGIIYCDLKPSNVLLNEFGTLKLSDFGLARRIVDMIQTDFSGMQGGLASQQQQQQIDPVSTNNNNNNNNVAGCKKGTPFYMAPELFEDDGVHSYQSDLWALGCILHELATGKPPFVSTSFAELVNLIVKAETPRVEGFSEEFNDLLRRLLEKDPVKRADWNVMMQHPFWQNCQQGLACSGFAAYQQQGGDGKAGNQAQLLLANSTSIQVVPIPPQPHFENWLKGRLQSNASGVVVAQQQQQQQMQLQQQLQQLQKEQKEQQLQMLQQQQVKQQQQGPGMQMLLADHVQQQQQQQILMTPVPGQKEINVMRLSLNVKKNLQKEDNQPGYNVGKDAAGSSNQAGKNNPNNKQLTLLQQQQQQQLQEVEDVKLANRDQELDFGDNNEEEHDEDEQFLNNNNNNEDDQQQPGGCGSGQELEDNVEAFQQQQQQLAMLQQQQKQQQQQFLQANNATTTGKKKTTGQAQLATTPTQEKHPHHGNAQQQQQQYQPHQGLQQQSPLNLPDELMQGTGGVGSVSPNSNLLAIKAGDTPSRQLIMPGGEGNQTPVSKVKQIPLEQLFTHNTDNAVKPIIGNRDIERATEATFQRELLPFEAFQAEDVINGIDSPQIEQHFEQIYTALVSTAPSSSSSNLQNNNVSGQSPPPTLLLQQQQQQQTDVKLNILHYFETIVQHSNVSNRLINSQFMNLLLKLLKTAKSVNMKMRIGSIVGLLIRHATVIETELSSLGIPGLMIELLKNEKTEKVKRKAIATLGEYLFYGATQMDEDPQNTAWDLPPAAYQAVLKTLKTANEDEVVKFYAAKTVENITAQSVSTGAKFSNTEVAGGLISLYFQTKNENLKICTIVCLTHMTVLNNALIEFILEKFAGNLVSILREAHQRIQQAFQTILNMHILNAGALPKGFENDREFFAAVVLLLESPNVVIRGKAVLMLLLMVKIQPRTLIILAETKFYLILDRLIRDQFKYVQQCLFHLLELLDEMIPHILKIVSDELAKAKKAQLEGGIGINQNQNESQYYYFDYNNNSGAHSQSEHAAVHHNQNGVARLKGNLSFLVVLLQYLRCSTLSPKVFNHNYLEILFAFLDFFEIEQQPQIQPQQQQQQQQQFIQQQQQQQQDSGETITMSDAVQQQQQQQQPQSVAMNEAKAMLFMIYEAVVANQKYVLNNSDFFVKVLLPKLAKLLLSSGQADMRFNSLKLFIDVLNQIMNEPTIYEFDAKKPQNVTTAQARAINDFLLKNLLPNVKRLLADADPIPFFAIKLLNLLLEKNTPLFAQAAKKARLVHEIFANYFQPEHPRLTKNTLRILFLLCASHELSWQELSDLGAVPKTLAVLRAHAQRMQEWAFQDLLDLLLALAQRFLEALALVCQPQPQSQGQPQPQLLGKALAIISPESPAVTAPQVLPLDPAQACALVGGGFEGVAEVYDLVFSLLSHADYNISEKSASLLLHLIYVFGAALKNNDQLISLERLVDALAGLTQTLGQGGANAARVRRQLKALWWAVTVQDKKIKLQGDKTDVFLALVDKCVKQDDKLVAQYAKELIKWIA